MGSLGSPGRGGVPVPDRRGCDRQNRSFCHSFALKLTYFKAVSGAFPPKWEPELQASEARGWEQRSEALPVSASCRQGRAACAGS